MTKTYAITEEQRAKVIEALSHPHGFRAEARGIMQSLPLITGEPTTTPPCGSKRKAALDLYRAPFKFEHGYIFDADYHMVADDDDVESHVAARVRGWGRIGGLPDAAELQDEVGRVIADALTAYWASPQPLQPITADDEAIEHAAQTLAECMDYPWAYMPEHGRKEMRTHAHAIVSTFIKHKGDTK